MLKKVQMATKQCMICGLSLLVRFLPRHSSEFTTGHAVGVAEDSCEGGAAGYAGHFADEGYGLIGGLEEP